MGLFDALTGRTLALNSILKPAAYEVIDIANNITDDTFISNYFKSIGMGALAFIQYCYNFQGNSSSFKKNIKNITPERANMLIKLLSMHFTLSFLSNETNMNYMELDGHLESEELIDAVTKYMAFTNNDKEVFHSLLTKFETLEATPSLYPMEWYRWFHMSVLGQNKSTMDIVESTMTYQVLSFGYKHFLESVWEPVG